MWKGIDQYTIHTVLERSRHRAPIIVFISHSKGDKKQYRVSNLKNELKGQEEISEVLGNGENDISESHLVSIYKINHYILFIDVYTILNHFFVFTCISKK